MTCDRHGHDDDGVPPPTEPPPELAEVYPLHPPTGTRGLGLSGPSGLVIEDLGTVLERVDQAGPPRPAAATPL